MTDLIKSLRKQIKQRISSPLFGTFVLSWVCWNHQYLFILASDGTIESRLSLATRLVYPDILIGIWRVFLAPLLCTFLFIVLYPLLNAPLFRYWHRHQVALKEQRDKIEGAAILTRDESEKLLDTWRTAREEYLAKIQKLEKDSLALRAEPSFPAHRVSATSNPAVPPFDNEQEKPPALHNPNSELPPVVLSAPSSVVAPLGGAAQFTAIVDNVESATISWDHDGTEVKGTSSSALTFSEVKASDAGLYRLTVQRRATIATSTPAILGVHSTSLVAGAASQVSSNVRHPNGNTYDHFLLQGSSAVVTAAQGNITQIVFIDPNDDIVRVDFSGPGALTVLLDEVSGPSRPLKYNQDVQYMKGLAGLVIAGADDRTNVAVFASGRVNTFDPTGTFDFLRPTTTANAPANNRSPMWRSDVQYDGMADLRYVAILSGNGKFGGLRAANVRFSGSRGHTGIFAPGVQFSGPVYVGDIHANSLCTPTMILGSANDVRVCGGDFSQRNGQAIHVKGISLVRFTQGGNAHGVERPARRNLGVLVEDGHDVTRQIVAL